MSPVYDTSWATECYYVLVVRQSKNNVFSNNLIMQWCLDSGLDDRVRRSRLTSSSLPHWVRGAVTRFQPDQAPGPCQ